MYFYCIITGFLSSRDSQNTEKTGIPNETIDPWSGGPSYTDKSQEINIKKSKQKFFASNQFSSTFSKYSKLNLVTESEIGLIV